MTNPRILFILKLRQQSGGGYSVLRSSGLLNSATYINDMLNQSGVESKLVEVTDNNSIDREVTAYRPTIVVVEALWVVPEKFEILRKLHPKVQWIIRVHSEIPFLANEGNAMNWITAYLKQPKLYVSLNSEKTFKEFVDYFLAIDESGKLVKKLIYLPNYYPVKKRQGKIERTHPQVLDIGIFGSIRPMKNQLIQAFAAVEYARHRDLPLRVHINSGRLDNVESGPVLLNLRAFFAALPLKYQLVEHDWLDREDFLAMLRTMDVNMTVSLSETFCICACDSTSEGIPTVVSPEVGWMPEFAKVNPTLVKDIVEGIEAVMFFDSCFGWLDLPRKKLKNFVAKNKQVWLKEIDVLSL